MKIYKYSIIAIAFLSIVSCGDDEFSREYQDTEVKTALVGTLTLSNTKATAGSLIDFNVTIPGRFSSEVTVEVTATSNYNDIEVNKIVIKKYVTIAAGETTGSGTLTMPGSTSLAADFFGIEEYALVSITGIKLTEGDDPFVMTSETIPVTFLQTNGNYHEPYGSDFAFAGYEDYPGWNDGVDEPWLIYSFDWADSENVDLDLYVYLDDVEKEYSETSTRFEGDFFNGNWFPDGVYDIYVAAYYNTGAVDYRFTATDHNGKVTMIESSLTESGYIGTITKSGGITNDITYVIEGL